MRILKYIDSLISLPDINIGYKQLNYIFHIYQLMIVNTNYRKFVIIYQNLLEMVKMLYLKQPFILHRCGKLSTHVKVYQYLQLQRYFHYDINKIND